MVKVYDVILTFDTSKSNEQIEAEIDRLIDSINYLLSRNIKDSLPQLYKDCDKKSRISIVPIKNEDLD
ncbi:hypothetical protein UFOVP410_89 [uncultured Caudovirales phage]|uniref:Uncharacterized protein n=1 Tax=uncultured Caudovirales phage TaxID=2100421 RepID=A0A6J5M803_9CAUD|nr:hypothetical protein UFOVP410_89 [uncultured Caudovirales phage]